MASRIWSLRSWMAPFAPPPSRMMVSSLLMVTFLAVPSMAGSTLSRLRPTSSLMTCRAAQAVEDNETSEALVPFLGVGLAALSICDFTLHKLKPMVVTRADRWYVTQVTYMKRQLYCCAEVAVYIVSWKCWKSLSIEPAQWQCKQVAGNPPACTVLLTSIGTAGLLRACRQPAEGKHRSEQASAARAAGPHLSAGERGDVLQVGLAVVAKARRLDGCQLHAAAQLVHDERRERLRLNVLRDDQQRPLRLHHILQDGQQGLQPAGS